MIRCIKHRFQTREDAVYNRKLLYKANSRKKSRRVGYNTKQLNVFHCEICDAWHIGHTRGWEKNQHLEAMDGAQTEVRQEGGVGEEG